MAKKGSHQKRHTRTSKKGKVFGAGKGIFKRAKAYLVTHQETDRQRRQALKEYNELFSSNKKLIEYQEAHMSDIHNWQTIPVFERRKIIKRLSKKYPLVNEGDYPVSYKVGIRMATIGGD